MKKYINRKQLLYCLYVIMLMAGCQKLNKPLLSDYPKDANPAGGPLKFYVAFDGSSENLSLNAVDSIMATFPADNPLKPTEGINKMAIQGESEKFVKYSKPNDWALTAKSFTLSFWIKRDGQTKNNTGTNGPEFIMSFKSSNGHWSGANMLVLLEGNNSACAVKTLFVDKANKESWLNWEGGNTVSGLLDNNWHHLALVYDATKSTMTLYQDGKANSNIKSWADHGDINLDDSKITEMRIGCGPNNSFAGDDWLSSTWKGAVDQYRMYGIALTADEVAELYTAKK